MAFVSAGWLEHCLTIFKCDYMIENSAPLQYPCTNIEPSYYGEKQPKSFEVLSNAQHMQCKINKSPSCILFARQFPLLELPVLVKKKLKIALNLVIIFEKHGRSKQYRNCIFFGWFGGGGGDSRPHHCKLLCPVHILIRKIRYVLPPPPHPTLRNWLIRHRKRNFVGVSLAYRIETANHIYGCRVMNVGLHAGEMSNVPIQWFVCALVNTVTLPEADGQKCEPIFLFFIIWNMFIYRTEGFVYRTTI